MPVYFFDSYNGQLNVHDDEGLDLPDLAQAKKAAFRTLGDMARDLVLVEGAPLELSVDVRDRPDHILTTASARFEMRDAAATPLPGEG